MKEQARKDKNKFFSLSVPMNLKGNNNIRPKAITEDSLASNTPSIKPSSSLLGEYNPSSPVLSGSQTPTQQQQSLPSHLENGETSPTRLMAFNVAAITNIPDSIASPHESNQTSSVVGISSSNPMLKIATDPSVILVKPVAVFSGAKSMDLGKMLPDMDSEHQISLLQSKMAQTPISNPSIAAGLAVHSAKTHYHYGSIASSASSATPKSSANSLGSFFFTENNNSASTGNILASSDRRINNNFKVNSPKQSFSKTASNRLSLRKSLSPGRKRNNQLTIMQNNSISPAVSKVNYSPSQSDSDDEPLSTSNTAVTNNNQQDSPGIPFHADNAWTFIYDKTICLFNGEGLKTQMEELNKLVRQLMDRWPYQALVDHVRDLVKDGLHMIKARLTKVSDESILTRLADIWTFFLGSVLPYLQGVFLPLSTDVVCNSNGLVLNSVSFNVGPIGDVGTLGTTSYQHGSAVRNNKQSTISNKASISGIFELTGSSPSSTVSPTSPNNINTASSTNSPKISSKASNSNGNLNSAVNNNNWKQSVTGSTKNNLDVLGAVPFVDVKKLILLEFRNIILVSYLQTIDDLYLEMLEDCRSGKRSFDSLSRIMQMLCILHGIEGIKRKVSRTGSVKRSSSIKGEDTASQARLDGTLKLIRGIYDRQEWVGSSSKSSSQINLAVRIGSTSSLS